jgi:hypothetical protein
MGYSKSSTKEEVIAIKLTTKKYWTGELDVWLSGRVLDKHL